MIRGITLRGAVALNVITMIGIGPLITIPLVLAQLAGPLALIGWVAGAGVALCDGLVWAELGSRYPSSGGTYAYLREIFGAHGWGRLLAFLFNWQFFLSASLILSTGYIGFANYAGYIFPKVGTSAWLNHSVALAVGILTIMLLYRRITAIAAFGIALAALAIGTLILVGSAGYFHADFHRAFTLGTPHAFGLGFLAGLGGALYITLYDYLGYSQIALVGEEVHEPHRTLPRSIVTSILLVLVLYLFVQIGVLAAIPWQTLVGHNGGPPPPQAQYVASTVVANSWGTVAARVVTVLVLITAFASVYGGLLGGSRVPFAAARDGAFLPMFAKLHPTKNFPYVSLLAMGAISLAACFFDLSFVIAVIGTSSILIGSIMQIVALFVFRYRGGRSPFRMWLFPIPALIALCGWALAFANTGTAAIALGVGWLAVGTVVYLLIARKQRAWPFTAAALFMFFLACSPLAARANQAPYFLYGASFFYERIPRAQWDQCLAQYRSAGFNTIDLYVMWNWHEPTEGEFDFTGRTNARRDLAGLLRLIHRHGFRIVLRPGPVIRNEWRNGGYPGWLLQRPEYRMPLRDVLEGRYPATATLQNAHADAAAAEWLHNSTHMRYSAHWLRRVLHVAAPYRSDVVAVALDDDQGAYIDNDTWPGRNFHRYINVLRGIVQRTLGGQVPVFINTYQMKVTASAPVWAWGNWYQSDAYSIGEHDRAQLEFSTGLLQTQPGRDVMVSEFQAGWLQGADEAVPRPADPTNTTLALHTLLQLGAHGVVDFPPQDTLNPSGWEAPWTNAFYSWDAALSVALQPQARYTPTKAFGTLIRRYGALLAQTQPVADAAIAYMTSAYEPSALSTADIFGIAQATIQAQRGCRVMRLTCRLVDLRFDSPADLAAARVLIVPQAGIREPYIARVRQTLSAFRAAGGRIVHSARDAHIARPAAAGIPNGVLLRANNGRFGFLDVVNYTRSTVHIKQTRVAARGFAATVPAFDVPARDAVLLPLGKAAALKLLAPLPATIQSPPRTEDLPLRDGSWIEQHGWPANHIAVRDVYHDGYPAVVLQSTQLRMVISPCAGARALVFEDRATGENLFTTIGGFRDTWSPAAPPSSRDYIAQYTHPIATGTFNRCYASSVTRNAASFHYAAPDAPGGATFERSISLRGSSAVEESMSASAAAGERLEQLSSFSATRRTDIMHAPNGCALYDSERRRLLLLSWRGHGVRSSIERRANDVLVTVTYGAGHVVRMDFGVDRAPTASAAQARLAAFANRR